MDIKIKDFTDVNAENEKLLAILDQICRENSLDYFAIAGFLSNAVLNNNFDCLNPGLKIELGLIRDDFDKLSEVINAYAEEYEFKVSTENKKGVPGFQIIITKPYCIENELYKITGNSKIYISVFDFVPDEKAERELYYAQVGSLRSKYNMYVKRYQQKTKKSLKPKEIYKFMRKKIKYNGSWLSQGYEDLLRETTKCKESGYIRRLVPSTSRQVLYEDIFPTKRIKFSDIEINIPNNPGCWIDAKDRYLDDYNLAREGLLADIGRICKENSFEYFAFANLLIGAVHYEDFIPEDFKSAAEIGLIRSEFDKLIGILENNSEKFGFRIITENENGLPTFKCKVQREFTAFNGIMKKNAEIVINAFDFVPDSLPQRKAFFRGIAIKNKLLKKHKDRSVADRIDEHKKILAFASRYDNTSYIRRLLPTWSKLVPYDDIFPVKKVKFRDIELSIPNNYSHWTVKLDDELMERTRTIQKIDLEITKEFDRVCRILDVGYFVCGGTMLGHMRHGGFIPWDDDMDVGMLRADYDRFIAEAPKYLSADFFLQTRESDKKIPYLFSKIRMNETEYITTYNELRDFHKGICLDLFPFDYIPNEKSKQKKFRKKVRKIEKIHNRFCNGQLEKPVYENSVDSFAEFSARFLVETKRLLMHMVPLSLTQKLYIKEATKYNSKAEKLGLTTVASFVPTYTYAKTTDMLPYQDVNFEGITVKALCDMDKFLTMQYGDYMQLPAEHQRVGHDLIRWSISDAMAEKYNIR